MRKFCMDLILTIGIVIACFSSFCMFYLGLAIDKIKSMFK